MVSLQSVVEIDGDAMICLKQQKKQNDATTMNNFPDVTFIVVVVLVFVDTSSTIVAYAAVERMLGPRSSLM